MNEERKFYVYAYLRSVDSKNGEVGTPYYIGKGCGNRAFATNHGVRIPKDKDNVIFKAYGLTEQEAFSAEQHFIRLYGRIDVGTGCLRNLSDGGEGKSGYIPSAETKQKMSLALKGKKHSEKHRQNLALALTGKKRSEESRLQMSLAHIGKSNPNKGKTLSEETRRKMILAKRGCVPWNKGKKGTKLSDEHRLKLSLSRRGKKHSDEHRLKLSIARKLYLQRKESSNTTETKYIRSNTLCP